MICDEAAYIMMSGSGGNSHMQTATITTTGYHYYSYSSESYVGCIIVDISLNLYTEPVIIQCDRMSNQVLTTIYGASYDGVSSIVVDIRRYDNGYYTGFNAAMNAYMNQYTYSLDDCLSAASAVFG